MNQRDPEYDRFGPWVIEISEEDPPPPLFVPHLARTETPLLSLKIPRRISRREAHPGMDLYDYLVSLYDADMVVLQRVEHQVRSRTIRYRDIRSMWLHEELLRGRLHLALADEDCELSYNTVSGDLVGRLVRLIHERYRGTPPGNAVAVEATELSELSFYFERLLRDEQASGSGLRPLAAQPETQLGAFEESLPRRVFFGLVAKRLLESLHLSDGWELKVIDRGQPHAYRWQSVYGRKETWIPLANITSVDWDWGPDDTDSSPVTVTIGTEAGRSAWVFTPSNPTLGHYRRFLSAALEARRP